MKAVKGIKFRGLPKEDIEAFLIQMELRFKDLECTQDVDKVRAVCQSLQGEAAAWIAPAVKKYGVENLLSKHAVGPDNTVTLVSKGAWDSLNDFYKWLRLRHGKHYNLEQDAARKIFALRQGKSSITEFNAEFDRLRMYLPETYTKEVILFAYKNALNPDVIARISNNPGVETWDVDLWMSNTQIIEGNREFNVNRETAYLPRYHGKYHPLTEDMMDVDVNKQEVGKESRKCFNCGLKGHLKVNCRRKPFKNKFRQGKNFFKKKFVKRNTINMQDEAMEIDKEQEQEHF